VTVAGDGKEGLIAAPETLPDLILLDMMLSRREPVLRSYAPSGEPPLAGE
jgi:CheY-like chemotaxis protein